MQTIKAYYNEGTFTPFESVMIPQGSHAIITILDFVINQEQLPEVYFTRSKDMCIPINFDEAEVR